MKGFRQALVEAWAVSVLAGVVGFMGPFGTYATADFLPRFGRWWALLMGAYILVRPLILVFDPIARGTGLPVRPLTFWGMVAASFPLTLIWQLAGADELRLLGGYAGLFPFGLLCSVTVLLVAWWAERVDATAADCASSPTDTPAAITKRHAAIPQDTDAKVPAILVGDDRDLSGPRLLSRLPAHSSLPILALESEDHYVRVHGPERSELILVRLRDAIAEMDDVEGTQVHRSWWVAASAVASATSTGRILEIELTNGLRVPVARDSIARLRSSGFLPR